jgi:hypothetical protein
MKNNTRLLNQQLLAAYDAYSRKLDLIDGSREQATAEYHEACKRIRAEFGQ